MSKFNSKKKLPNYFVYVLISLLILFILFPFFIFLILYIFNIYLTYIFSLVLTSGLLYFSYKIIFKKKNLITFSTLFILPLFLIGIFSFMVLLVPIEIGKVSEYKHPSKEIYTLSKGEEIGVYFLPAKEKKHANSILFVPGGPGGSIGKKTLEFLAKFSAEGYDTYSYNHYTSDSTFYNYDQSLVTLQDELRRLSEIINKIYEKSNNKIYLMGHSYAGALLGRYLAEQKNADKIERVVFLDTSGFHSLPGGNIKENSQGVLNPDLKEEFLIGLKNRVVNTIPKLPFNLPLFSYTENMRLRILFLTSSLFPQDPLNHSFFSNLIGTLNVDTKEYKQLEIEKITFFTGLGYFYNSIYDDKTFSENMFNVIYFMNALGYNAPFGNGLEIMYYFDSLGKKSREEVIVQLHPIGQRINREIENSDDYYKQLIQVKTPKSLVLYPEFSAVGWAILKDYESFLDDVTYVLVPKVGHGVWANDPVFVAEKIIAFFQNNLTEKDIYTKIVTPFKQK